jgi:hypothetical protein
MPSGLDNRIGSRAAPFRGKQGSPTRLGNVDGLQDVVQAAPEVATETALTFVSHRGLDPIADRRLVWRQPRDKP